jgi:hypothetical protein
MAMIGMTAPFMVMETDILSNGMSLNRIFMSSTESMATPEKKIANQAGIDFKRLLKATTVEQTSLSEMELVNKTGEFYLI